MQKLSIIIVYMCFLECEESIPKNLKTSRMALLTDCKNEIPEVKR